MLAGIHFLTGTALGTLTQNQFLAFSLGFISHHLLDRLPHLDLNLFNNQKYASLKNWDYKAWLLFLTEFSFFFLLTFYFLGKYPFEKQLIAFIGGLGALMPDIISFSLRTFLPNFKFFDFYLKFHKNFHYQFKKEYFLPIIIELITIAFCLFIFNYYAR